MVFPLERPRCLMAMTSDFYFTRSEIVLVHLEVAGSSPAGGYFCTSRLA